MSDARMEHGLLIDITRHYRTFQDQSCSIEYINGHSRMDLRSPALMRLDEQTFHETLQFKLLA